jgi:hypothetical protein
VICAIQTVEGGAITSDRPEAFKATADLAERADITFAQFVMRHRA